MGKGTYTSGLKTHVIITRVAPCIGIFAAASIRVANVSLSIWIPDGLRVPFIAICDNIGI